MSLLHLDADLVTERSKLRMYVLTARSIKLIVWSTPTTAVSIGMIESALLVPAISTRSLIISCRKVNSQQWAPYSTVKYLF